MKRILLTLALAAALPACTDPCLALAEKLCECEPSTSAVDNCKSQAQSEDSQVSLTSADKDACNAKLDKCDCHMLDPAGKTPEQLQQAKQTCGLAR